MNGSDYLNQISASNRPTSKPSIFSSKILKFALIGGAAAIFIIVVGSMLKNFSTKKSDLLEQANLRMTNLTASITTYNRNIKSSRLRSMNVSLSGVFADSTRNITNILTTEYEYDPKKPNSNITDEETTLIGDFNTTMEDAKLNGILDRIWVREMTLQLALLISLESEAAARSSEPSTIKTLEDSQASLNQLYEQFSAFADSTN